CARYSYDRDYLGSYFDFW
nr:immunoglobulin heavy chain junction region [Macaca mulatta]MOY18057.1 immunoglobulin heavy chain junction region [Macaca mulatta]MOY18263.1 immunoglobulin heavy chain junction region [Macaca mulatta]MOY18348.1 immunoglobulin heavy chain junction region [Macaca mulatta]MOY18948.1 immunoglobulin heavy chain junction region [Macaca mulatta]